MFVNTTPHDVDIYAEDKKTIIKTIPKSKWQIRLRTTESKYKETVDDIPIWSAQEFDGIYFVGQSVEEFEKELRKDDKKLYIVSLLVKDYVIKYFGPEISAKICTVGSGDAAVRDEKGKTIGTTKLLN